VNIDTLARSRSNGDGSALNKRIAGLLEEFNARPMKKLGGVSRRDLFEHVEQKCAAAALS
jgi:hypothetical protein